MLYGRLAKDCSAGNLIIFHYIGKGVSMWDKFTHDGRAKNGDTTDIASDSYHLYMDDVNILKELNVR